jgi:Ni,Fe-hydrogenase III large subunit
MSAQAVAIENGEAIPVAEVPEISNRELRDLVVEACQGRRRVSALFGDARDGGTSDDPVELYAVIADEDTASLHLARTRVEGGAFESLTPECPQVHLFEREIAEQYACVPRGHPWLKPVRFHPPYRRPASVGETPAPVVGVMDYYRVEGDEVHEVAVGPVHAGIIEPGHFRFQCHGETVFHLEISLGYQHRGIERRLVGGPGPRTPHYMETLAGDTTIGHATAYCHAVEALAGVHAPAKAQFIRGIALELERLANHVGDLGALAGDVGYLPTASFCGRIRGDYLNMSALLCGSRLGRDLTRPGGVRFDVDGALRDRLLERLDAAERDTASAVNLLWESSSVMSRFEDAGRVTEETAREMGLVGPAVRASGVSRDVRTDFPKGVYRYRHVPTCTWSTGDVFARAYVRWLEIQHSIRFVREELQELPAGPVRVGVPPLMPERIVVSLVEGWRGEICHAAITDDAGRFRRYKVVDPSFHNWSGLALALRGQEISDFPLCNKSFNLSYAGFDL